MAQYEYNLNFFKRTCHSVSIPKVSNNQRQKIQKFLKQHHFPGCYNMKIDADTYTFNFTHENTAVYFKLFMETIE